MSRRTVGWLIFGLCALVTVGAVAIGLSRGPAAEVSTGGLFGSGDRVAMIRLDGAITDAMVAPQSGGRQNVYAQLRRAERDRSVKAVVLRVNSPGGSASASQAIYEQVKRLRAAGKKVVVHFTDVAASGGYYVAAGADRIVSQPTAITGSIGVILVSADLQGLYDKIGYRERVFKSGPHKDILSVSRDLTPEDRAILDKLVQDTYNQFVKVVVEGRGLPEAEVRRIADGRVISGSEAFNLRLVDELGDQYRAVQLAGELAGMAGEPRVVLFEPPRQSSLLDLLGGLTGATERLEELLPPPGLSVRYELRQP